MSQLCYNQLLRPFFKLYLKIWYKKRTGKTLNLDNPQTYNEKIQWLKIYDSTYLKTQLTDKYLVRDWIKEQIGEEYLIPILGVWDSFDEIDFDKLPDKFVLKANHASGWNIIANGDFDKIAAKKRFGKWMKRSYAYRAGLELHYKGIKPKIIAEQYVTDKNGELNDYKVICFNGEPRFVWVDTGRYTQHRRNVYDLNWNLQPFSMQRERLLDRPIPPPENLKQMIEIARKLSSGFLMARVDFYDVDGKLYFGEITFTSETGIAKFTTSEYDLELGQMISLVPIK